MQQLKYTEPTEEEAAEPETAIKTEIFVMLPMVRFTARKTWSGTVSDMQKIFRGGIDDMCASKGLTGKIH